MKYYTSHTIKKLYDAGKIQKFHEYVSKASYTSCFKKNKEMKKQIKEFEAEIIDLKSKLNYFENGDGVTCKN